MRYCLAAIAAFALSAFALPVLAPAEAAADNDRVRLFFDTDGRVFFNVDINGGHHKRSGKRRGYVEHYGYRAPRYDRRVHHRDGRRYRGDGYHRSRKFQPYCERVRQRGYHRGYPALVSFRVCYSPRGNAYRVKGSRRFIRYLDGHRHHRGRY